VIGFVWTFCFKWPHSISALFFRRCELCRAQYVAVCVKRSEEEVVEISVFDHHRHIRRLRKVFNVIGRGIGFIMTNLFSDANTFGLDRSVDGVYEICKVREDVDGTRYIMFMFRRYVLEGGRFVPGQLHIGATVEDIASATDPAVGLNREAVQDRRHVVGPNLVDMGKPNVFRTIWKQVSQPFYTWQMFFVWTVRQFGASLHSHSFHSIVRCELVRRSDSQLFANNASG
jgi:Cation transporter/ATPase, N-terminus